ncbi:MgtC/SapB family protein [Pseudoroseomonas sp. WGS1072]|uniref:MgtC/SapB family protein n=1 Tax=Roseomonas sp. WGS1072 TaxID=3366816 RepID=UPI003BF03496
MMMTDPSTEDILLRLGGAAGLGMLLGLDWERRGFDAGIRTHGLIALSAALLMLSATSIAATVLQSGGESDPLRIAQGLFQALGFIGAGMVFAWREEVRNLTSASSLVLTGAIGMSCGAGHWRMALIAAGLGLILMVMVRLGTRHLPGRDRAEGK